VPGHRIQVDVKFLPAGHRSFKDPAGKMKKLYQYTAIDDATRARALKIYPKHNQETAIEFVDYVRGRFPFRIHTIQTDNGWSATAARVSSQIPMVRRGRLAVAVAL